MKYFFDLEMNIFCNSLVIVSDTLDKVMLRIDCNFTDEKVGLTVGVGTNLEGETVTIALV